MPGKVTPDVITSAIELWHKIITEKEVYIKFTKKDGNIRFMRCTLDFTKVPKEDKPKEVKLKNILKTIQATGVMHVYDLDKKGWRSVPFQRVEYLKTRGGKQFSVQPMKRTGVDKDANPRRFNKSDGDK